MMKLHTFARIFFGKEKVRRQNGQHEFTDNKK